VKRSTRHIAFIPLDEEIMSKPVCLTDFEAHFLRTLDRNARDYFSSGANNEQTLRDNVEAFNRFGDFCCMCVD